MPRDLQNEGFGVGFCQRAYEITTRPILQKILDLVYWFRPASTKCVFFQF